MRKIINIKPLLIWKFNALTKIIIIFEMVNNNLKYISFNWWTNEHQFKDLQKFIEVGTIKLFYRLYLHILLINTKCIFMIYLISLKVWHPTMTKVCRTGSMHNESLAENPFRAGVAPILQSAWNADSPIIHLWGLFERYPLPTLAQDHISLSLLAKGLNPDSGVRTCASKSFLHLLADM